MPENNTSLTEDAVEQQLKAFIARKSRLVKIADITRQTVLFSSGLLDSLTFVQLVAFLETTFRIKFPPAMVATLTSMDTIDQIVQAVRKLGNAV